MNTTRDVVAPAMRAAAEDTYGDDADRIFTSDTRDLVAFFVVLRKLLTEVIVFCSYIIVWFLTFAVWCPRLYIPGPV
jgi:hypothetical protein